jgi:large subunit ribosomal protein L3
MIPGILGRKIGMTHLFDKEKGMVPVTVIQAGPMYVTQIKSVDTDGYNAVQFGFEEMSEKHLTFPKFGHLKKANVLKNLRILKEFRVESVDGYDLGQQFAVDQFEEGSSVVVIGNTKGRGFQGGVKRHHFAGQQMTHGKMGQRRTMSNGATGPQRVFKGSRRAGHMGTNQITQLGLKIVKVDQERNLILVSGGVPGPNGALVVLKRSSR